MTPNGAVEPVQDAVHSPGFPRLRAVMRMGSDCSLRNPRVSQDESRGPCRNPARPVHRIGARSTDRWDSPLNGQPTIAPPRTEGSSNEEGDIR
jgi:hypothetical protein